MKQQVALYQVLFIVVFILVFMQWGKYFLAYAGSYQDQYVVPKKVGIYLQDITQNKRLPDLAFTVYAGGGFDQAKNLDIITDYKSNQPNIFTKGERIDILQVNIQGYEFRQFRKGPSDISPAVIIESRARIDLSEYMKNDQLQLKIFLNNKENIYDVYFYEGILYLNPLQAENVISWNPGENMPDHAQYIGYMTREFLGHLAKLNIEGVYVYDSDLPQKIREFVRQNGYTPLDEKIQNYPTMNPLEDFIIFVPDGNVSEEYNIIGQIKFNEAIGGEKTVKVGLKRAVLNPFFVRNI